jgi:hypothetical protein
VDDGTGVIDCREIHPAPPKHTPAYLISPLSPVAGLGAYVCIIGKIVNHYETKEVVIDKISECRRDNRFRCTEAES